MNAETRKPRDDRQLEQDLEALHATWARQEAEEPPALIDRAVLNRARRELDAQAAAGSGRRRRRWLGAFATATVFVLALSIVVQQEPAPPPEAEGNGLRLERSAPAVPQRAKATSPAAAAAAEEQQDQGSAARAMVAQPAAEHSADTAADVQALESHALRESLSDAPEQPAETLQPPSAGTPAEQSAATEYIPPEDWIERMRALLRAGRLAELERERAAFRAAWPDHPLPPELQEP